jgi:hypothetical protein
MAFSPLSNLANQLYAIGRLSDLLHSAVLGARAAVFFIALGKSGNRHCPYRAIESEPATNPDTNRTVWGDDRKKLGFL